MKLLFTALVCLLLCGCAPRPEIAPPPTEPVAEAKLTRSAMEDMWRCWKK